MKRLLLLAFILSGCTHDHWHIQTEFLTTACIRPMVAYHYMTCDKIIFKIDDAVFEIPEHFQTDLASIPKIAWPIIAPAHSSLFRAAIVHDWFYTKTCDFDRRQTDLIFYHMLLNDGVPKLRASIMYYAVRIFGAPFYNEDYCDDEYNRSEKVDKKV